MSGDSRPESPSRPQPPQCPQTRTPSSPGDVDLPQVNGHAEASASPDSDSMEGVQFAAPAQMELAMPFRRHLRNRFGLRPPPPTQVNDSNSNSPLDLSAVNVGLIGAPTLAPENTPVPSIAPSDRTPRSQGLPTIEEALERLPDLSSDVSSAATTLADFPLPEDEDGFFQSSPVLPSSPTMVSRSSTPLSHHGVREHSDWQEDVEGDLDRSLARLANLASDDREQDGSLSIEQHYTRRLDAAIERQSTRYASLPDAKETINALRLQRAKLRSMLEFIVAEVVQDEGEIVASVAQLLAEMDQENIQ